MYREEILEGFDKTYIYTISSEAANSKGRVLILHGLHDHCGRYAHIADYFKERGFSTVRYDMRGYGKSSGLRGYINRFEDYTRDLHTVVEHYLKGSVVPNYLFAHSMGALIGSHYILQYGNPYRGVVFSGGLFKVNEDLSPVLLKLSGLISRLLPKMQTIKIDANGLSRDPEIAKNIPSDNLHFSGGVRARTGAEIVKATAKLERKLEILDFPMLILHGGADPLTKCEASELLYSKSKCTDKTLKIYPGAYHELINEINKEEVLQDIYSWIEERLPQSM